jgi:hypothetical protein
MRCTHSKQGQIMMILVCELEITGYIQSLLQLIKAFLFSFKITSIKYKIYDSNEN